MTEPSGRKAQIITLNEAETMQVVLNLDNRDCARSVECLDREARVNNISIKYLLVNSSRTAIPRWCLREDMQVLNFKVDFSRRGKFLTDAAEKFALESPDIFIAVSDARNPIIDNIAAMSGAKLKIGEVSRFSDNPYDLSTRRKLLQSDVDPAEELIACLKTVTGELERQNI